MNLEEAHDLMDLLLDKADQPYFTEEEKNEFLNQAITSFINHHYSTYDQEQVSRDALMYFTSNLIDVSSNDENTEWDGFSMKLPDNYVHLIHFRLSDNADGTNKSAAKIIGTKDFWDLEHSADPFNKPATKDPYCYVRHGKGDAAKIYFRPTTPTGFSDAVCLIFRNHNDCFSDDPNDSVKELYQREIIDIAIRKMTGNIEGANIQFQQIEAEQSKSI